MKWMKSYKNTHYDKEIKRKSKILSKSVTSKK